MKFLSRARKFLQGLGAEPESKVQYFNVTCASGHRVRGERTEGYQALRCPACGDGVFVLPRSPLPEPVAPARPQSAKAPGAGGGWPQEGPVELSDASRVSVEVVEDEAATNGAEILWEDVADEYITQPAPSNRHRDPASEDEEIDRSPGRVEESADGARAPERLRPRRPRAHGQGRSTSVGSHTRGIRVQPSPEGSASARSAPGGRQDLPDVGLGLDHRTRYRCPSSSPGAVRDAWPSTP